jgi:GAF domain-containing protein
MLKRNSTAPDKAQDEGEGYVKNALYVILITALIATGMIAIISTISLMAGLHVTISTIVVTATIFVISLVLLWLTWQERLALPRLFFPLVGFSAATYMIVTNYGIRDEGMFVYPLTIVLAGLLLGKVGIVVYTLLSLAAVAAVGYGEINGLIVNRFSASTTYVTVVILDVLLAFMGVLLYTTIDSLTNSLGRARRNERELAESNRELQTIRASLEERVQERTQELARRMSYLEATAAVARDAASVLNLQDLLSRVAVLISERFGFYHIGIFLTDATGEWAELQAASSEGGQRMLARRHRLQVKGLGIVPYAVSHGEPHIALDVGADAMHFDNPDLPDTRSEMALPLRARGQVIGALDVQSDQPQAFKQEDIVALQTLADQVALAINNAQLFQQAQESLEAERRAYAQQAGATWKEMLQSNPNLGYLYTQGVLARLENRPAAPQSAGQGRNGGGNTPPSQPEALPELKLPIKARGSVIGTINAHKSDNAGDWTPEEIALVETLTEQLGVALESARLYQDTQRRAARERLVGEVTARMRESLDLNQVLETAVNEISQALGLAALDVQLVASAEQKESQPLDVAR